MTYIGADFLHQLGQWILLPVSITCWTSSDGEEYTLFGKTQVAEDDSPQVKFEKIGCKSDTPVTARYVRIAVEGTKMCPSWHYGVGQPSWFFIDEVEIY